MTESSVEKGVTHRRGLLFGASAVAAGASALALMPKGVTSTEAALPTALPKPEKGGGYQVSDHVKHYYSTTRI